MDRTALEAAPRSDDEWGPARKLAFRFACIYVPWYALPDFAAGRDTFLSMGMDRLAAWFGEHALGLGEISVAFTSSGDMKVHYVKLLVMMLGSLAGALLWTLFDRRRPHYRRLAQWLVVGIRYYVLLVMLGYGFAKVFPSPISTTQLCAPAPDLRRRLTDGPAVDGDRPFQGLRRVRRPR